MARKRHFTDVQFWKYDGRRDTIRLVVTDMEDASITLEGHDLDMVAAAYFHLFGYTVEPGLKQFDLRKYKNGGVTHIVDDRMSIHHPDRRKKHALSWSLMVSDDRPGELRLWVQTTQTKMWMSLNMSKATTEEFGRRLASAAEWEVAA